MITHKNISLFFIFLLLLLIILNLYTAISFWWFAITILLGKMMEANTSRMVTLNGVDNVIWKGKMEDLFYIKKNYKPVFTIVKPENKTDEEICCTGSFVDSLGNGLTIMC